MSTTVQPGVGAPEEKPAYVLRQSKPGSAQLARACSVGPVKSLKDPRQLFAGNSLACIDHAYLVK